MEPPDEAAWLCDVLSSIFASPSWTTPISSWMDAHCLIFDADEEHKHAFHTAHQQFQAFVEARLEAALLDLGLTPEALASLAAASPPGSRLRTQIEEVLVVDDFPTFKRVMVGRNKELEAAALAALAEAKRRAPPPPPPRRAPVVQLQDDEEALAAALAASLQLATELREEEEALAAAIAASLQAPRQQWGERGLGAGSAAAAAGGGGAPAAEPLAASGEREVDGEGVGGRPSVQLLAAAATRAAPPASPASPPPPPPPPLPVPRDPAAQAGSHTSIGGTLAGLAQHSRAAAGLPPPPPRAHHSPAMLAALSSLPPLPAAAPPSDSGPVALVSGGGWRGGGGGEGARGAAASATATALPSSVPSLPPIQGWGGHARPLAPGPALGVDVEEAEAERVKRVQQLGMARAALVEQLRVEREAAALVAGGAGGVDKQRVAAAAATVLSGAGGAAGDAAKRARDAAVMAKIQSQVMSQHPVE